MGWKYFFEPDEDRSYRALKDPTFLEGNKKIDIALLKVIAGVIEALVK